VKRLLVTGGAGFIGSNFIRYMLDKYNTEIHITNMDLLTYAGNLDNLVDIDHLHNYQFVYGDISDAPLVNRVMREERITTVIHFAAESHVDRSIDGPSAFFHTNVMGTLTLLEAARMCNIERFIHISTDEVYGALGPKGSFSEQTALAPNSPYSASKASSDMAVRAFYYTYGLPVLITRCSNNYGPWQYPEKLIPRIITNAIRNIPIPVYGDGSQVRDWLHVNDHCKAIDLVYRTGNVGEVYNIGANNEMKNLQVVECIVDILGKSRSLIQLVEDRPGHDRRYAIDARKIREELGWLPNYGFNQGILNTVDWYMENEQWWEPLLNSSTCE
jgi:dTDP-glucose 4,6-dehydratase